MKGFAPRVSQSNVTWSFRRQDDRFNSKGAIDSQQFSRSIRIDHSLTPFRKQKRNEGIPRSQQFLAW